MVTKYSADAGYRTSLVDRTTQFEKSGKQILSNTMIPGSTATLSKAPSISRSVSSRPLARPASSLEIRSSTEAVTYSRPVSAQGVQHEGGYSFLQRDKSRESNCDTFKTPRMKGVYCSVYNLKTQN